MAETTQNRQKSLIFIVATKNQYYYLWKEMVQ